MFTPSEEIIQLLQAFSRCFTAPTFAKIIDLVCGAILSPGRRTVTSALRAIGLQSRKTFCNYHHVLSRNRWSAMRLSRILLSLLLQTFLDPNQPIDIVGDETLERRRGKKISYKGWFRDAVRSSHSVVVTALGIRWLCLCILVTVPWSHRGWALPFFTVPVCSEKNCQKRNRAFRGSIGLTIDALIKIRRWLGSSYKIRFIGDGGFSAMELLLFNRSLGITQIGRLNITAKLYDAPGEQPASKRGTKPKKGARQVSLKHRAADPNTQWQEIDLAWYGGQSKKVHLATATALWHVDGYDPAPLRWVLVRSVDHQGVPSDSVAAFFSTDVEMTAEQIVALYAQRWKAVGPKAPSLRGDCIEVFFEEVRACLGFETQRGWSDQTIGRTTPCLFGIFSLVVILAKRLFPQDLPVRQAAWYNKEEATFRDVLSAVREHLWQSGIGMPAIGMPGMGLGPRTTTLAPCQNMENNTTGSVIDDDQCLISRHFLATLQEMACYVA